MKATRSCSIDGCPKAATKGGMCKTHYQRWWRQGNAKARSDRSACTVTGCAGIVVSRKLCNRHYLKLVRHGNPLAGSEMPTGSDSERFWMNVDRTSDCWVWTAGTYADGYGAAKDSRVPRGQSRAHRLAYEWIVGPIPEGLVIDHVCHNRRCVNPSHLRAVTREENGSKHALVFILCTECVGDEDSQRVAAELSRQCCKGRKP
jgi:hypothetical protein